MLIVNADDYGHDRRASDAAAEVIREGVASSTTAMVFMEDSSRAASRATGEQIPVGLHLNLSEPFSARSIREDIRARQTSLTAVFSARGRQLRRWIYDPRIRAALDAAISDQLEEFERQFGCPPTHVDGHQHVHAALNVIFSKRLVVGTKMRKVVIDSPSARFPPLGQWRQRVADRKFVSTSRFFSSFELARIERATVEAVLTDAQRVTTEIMVHPSDVDERRLLTSSWWRDAAGGWLRTYRDLPR